MGPRPHAEHHPHPHVDLAARRERAAERAALVSRWAQRHQAAEPQVPFVVVPVDQPVTCASCGHEVRQGRVVQAREGTPSELCLPCGRRAILDWADRRRIESATARRLAHELRAVPAAAASEAPVEPAPAEAEAPPAPSPRAA